MKSRRLRLEGYGISAEAFDEMRALCLQYPGMKRELGKGAEEKSEERQKRLWEDCRDIEGAARESGGELAKWILRAVTEGCGYETLRLRQGMPCGEKLFQEKRRMFYVLLAKRRGKL